MAPTAGEEPRYDNVDPFCNSTPSTSTANPSCSNYSVHCENNESVSNNWRSDETPIDDDIATQIDPPDGFQPTPGSSSPLEHPSNSRTTTTTDCDNGPTRTSCSSTSSRISNSPSTISNSSSDNRHNDRNTYAQKSDNHQSSCRSEFASESPGQNGFSSNRESSEPTTSATTSDLSSSTNRYSTQPPLATSTYRIMNGFSSIVTKISKALANTSLPIISTDRCSQDEIPKIAFGHKRTLEKTWKLMDGVVKCCQHSRMNLNNSPPFILEILPETYQHLKLIYSKYDLHPTHSIDDNEYSQVFLRNLHNRCKQTLKLFKDAKEEMFDENSDYRHKLTRNTLVFNHILSELKAIYPGGRFIRDRYLITKKETAGEFWKNSFGSSVLVTWKIFYHALQQVHNIDSSFFSLHALKQTIDLTCDDHISIFEFDVFTRLFQPWSTLLRNWQILAVTHPGYKAFLTYEELKARLQRHIDKPGSYVFRLSCTRLGQWAIGYVTPDRQILQTIVQNISLSQALTETKFYLYPDGNDEDPSLSALCSGMAGDDRNVTVTEEQYNIYCGVGNSFRTCKICFENDKDLRVEPCNHLLCTSCLLSWQESEGHGCPYCRTEIKETVQITMDLPTLNAKSDST